MNTEKPINTALTDYPVNIKVKLAALWTSVTLCYLYGDYFELYVPGKTSGLLDGENLLDDPVKLLLASVLLAIPAVMVFLSVILKPLINRFLNIVFGLFFTLLMLFIACTSLTPWKSFYVFLALTESIITIMISVYAWKWKREKNKLNSICNDNF